LLLKHAATINSAQVSLLSPASFCISSSRVTGLDQWPSWPVGSSLVKKSGSGLGLKPSQPKLCLAKGVFGKTHPYAIVLIIYSHSILISIQTSFFFYIRKFQKYLGIFVDLFVAPGAFFFFFALFFSFRYILNP
jgi:hypothetical protein